MNIILKKFDFGDVTGNLSLDGDFENGVFLKILLTNGHDKYNKRFRTLDPGEWYDFVDETLYALSSNMGSARVGQIQNTIDRYVDEIENIHRDFS